MPWISFVLWALFAPPLAGDAVEVAVLVHDPATDGHGGVAAVRPPGVAMLADVAQWPNAKRSVAAMIVGTSGAVFEGVDCDDCAALQRGPVAAIGVGLEPREVEAIAVRVSAVGGDAIDRLPRGRRAPSRPSRPTASCSAACDARNR